MKFADRVRLAFSDQSMNEYIKDFMSGADLEEATSYNDTMDSATAMKYTAVFACNKVLAETFACMPAVLYRKGQGW